MSCSALTTRGNRCRNRCFSTQNVCLLHHKRNTNASSSRAGLCCARGTECDNAEVFKGCGYCNWHKPVVESAEEQLCTKMVESEGRVLHRCTNKKTGSSEFCGLHNKEVAPRASRILPQCSGFEEVDGVLHRCTRKSIRKSRDQKYCKIHSHSYRLEVPEDGLTCSICLGSIDEEKEIPLGCGHWMHLECLRGWNKPECPCCRSAYTTDEVRRIIKKPCSKILTRALYLYGMGMSLMGGEIMRLAEARDSNENFSRDTNSAMVRLLLAARITMGDLSETLSQQVARGDIVYRQVYSEAELARQFVSEGRFMLETPEAQAAMNAYYTY